MNTGIEQCFTDGFFGIVLLIRANKSLDRGNSLVAQSKIVYRTLELLEHGTAELLAVTELCAEFIFEHGDFRCVMAPVGKQQSEIGVSIVLRDAQRTIFLYRKLYTISIKCALCGAESQILFEAAGIFVSVSIRFFDHLTNLFGRCLHTGCALTNITTSGFHALGFQIVGLIAAFRNFDPNYFILLG